MHIEFLRHFIDIVETGGLSKAARKNHIAQPALTRQLQILEKEYGMPLIAPRRGSHSLTLTDAGWIVYREAKQICETEDNAQAELSALSAGLSGTLRLSIAPSYAPWLIAEILPAFHQAYPDICFRLRESYHLTLVEDVRQGISEIGIANAPLPDPTLFTILDRKPAILAAAIPSIWKEDAASLPALLSKHPIAVSRSTEELYRRLCEGLDIRPQVFYSVDTRSSAIRLAEENLAVSLLISQEIPPDTETLTCQVLPTPDIPLSQTIFCLRNHRLSKGMEKLLETMI